jgi:hypothetical protein
MLSFVYQLSFSGSLNPRPSLSLSTATSVYGRRGWLLPTLATRGAGNAPKATLTDTTCMRSETITTKMEHMQNTISAVSSALTTRNRGEERTEVRGGREQQRGEERNSEYVLGEIHRQTSPTGVPDCNVINQPTVCMTRDISAFVQACTGHGLVLIGGIAVLTYTKHVRPYIQCLVQHPILQEGVYLSVPYHCLPQLASSRQCDTPTESALRSLLSWSLSRILSSHHIHTQSS